MRIFVAYANRERRRCDEFPDLHEEIPAGYLSVRVDDLVVHIPAHPGHRGTHGFDAGRDVTAEPCHQEALSGPARYRTRQGVPVEGTVDDHRLFFALATGTPL